MNYTIIEEDDFVNSKNVISDPRSIDEAIDATMWALSRDPYVYDRAIPHFTRNGSPVHIAKTKKLRTVPPLIIWFCLDKSTVHLLDMQAIDEE
jgi:hypothetical protein